MTEQEALTKMIAPGTHRPTKWRQGVIQIWVTRACDKACYGCTQGSNLAGKPGSITLPQFEQACKSLAGYWGVVGMFGGNPATHPQFGQLCSILRQHFPKEQCGLWCNNPLGRGAIMQRTFNPGYSNLNVHLDKAAYEEFKRDWPESMPFGLDQDSRHSPPYVAMKDVVLDESERWELISNCDINKYWSAMIGVFRGQLRAWFCEVAGAQSMLHQDEPDYPDTGLDPTEEFRHNVEYKGRLLKWWELPMYIFLDQVRKHCHECSIPLRGLGELAQSTDPRATEQVSLTHAGIYKPKRQGRAVELVMVRSQVKEGWISRATNYLGNAKGR